MQTNNINITWENSLNRLIIFLMAVIFGWSAYSCFDDYDEVDIAIGEPVSISVSNSEIVLILKQANAEVGSILGASSTNMGTGSSISYILELDVASNNFASTMSYNMGKAVYQKKSFTHEEINTLLMDFFGFNGGEEVDLDIRITANVAVEGIEPQMTTSQITVWTYQPVSETLYMIGDAAPNG
ncbi:SusE domain-containing protein [Thermophagus sp. OGC60D27]|uniref:SusE domain-containing protein n=1 Tax=Thermophagus sp. OGC60D27 TaxID=3458415 RepID=UPI0040378F9B